MSICGKCKNNVTDILMCVSCKVYNLCVKCHMLHNHFEEKEPQINIEVLKKYTGDDSISVRELIQPFPKPDVLLHLDYILPNPKKKQLQSYCAMTGPFKDKYMAFREKYLGKTRLFDWAHYRYNLLVGHTPNTRGGWLFPQSKVEEIKNALKKEGILFFTLPFDQNIRIGHNRKQRREQSRRYRTKKSKKLLKESLQQSNNDVVNFTDDEQIWHTTNQENEVQEKEKLENTVTSLENEKETPKKLENTVTSLKNENSVSVPIGDFLFEVFKGDKISIYRCIGCGNICTYGKETTCCEKYACTNCIMYCQCGDNICFGLQCQLNHDGCGENAFFD